MDVPFRAFRRFNHSDRQVITGLRKRLRAQTIPHIVEAREEPTLIDRLVIALAEDEALPIKELFESFEFFERVRRRMRAEIVVDICCGHGLTGILFVIFSRPVQQVVLVDRQQPASFEKILAAAERVAPWIKGRVEYLEMPLKRAKERLPAQCSLVAVHACGKRTDRCISLAIEKRTPLAVMPCCYFGTSDRAPKALRRAFGGEDTSDIDRTYRLEAAGFRVEWSAIPKAITEKNRIIVARPR